MVSYDNDIKIVLDCYIKKFNEIIIHVKSNKQNVKLFTHFIPYCINRIYQLFLINKENINTFSKICKWHIIKLEKLTKNINKNINYNSLWKALVHYEIFRDKMINKITVKNICLIKKLISCIKETLIVIRTYKKENHDKIKHNLLFLKHYETILKKDCITFSNKYEKLYSIKQHIRVLLSNNKKKLILAFINNNIKEQKRLVSLIILHYKKLGYDYNKWIKYEKSLC